MGQDNPSWQNMATERLDYLLQKCRTQLLKKRDSEARVWLEMALDEFPSNRGLQRFAGKTYLQWGMTKKAIHFLEFSQVQYTEESPSESMITTKSLKMI